MEYVIPEYLREDILHGRLAEIIDNELTNYDFESISKLDYINFDDISKRFKAFICYKFLSIDDVVEKHTFIEILKTINPEMTVAPLVEQFISINVLSNTSFEELTEYVNALNLKYFKMVRNCMCKQYEVLSSNKFEEVFAKEIDEFLNNRKLGINKSHLSTLTKCAIIESARNNNSEVRFDSINEAIEYSFSLYVEQLLSLQERKKMIQRDREIIDEIETVLINNDFSR